MFLLNSTKTKFVNNRQISSFVLPGLTSLEKKYIEEQTELVLNPPKLEEELDANDHIPFIPNDHQSLYAYKRRINALQLANISNKKFWSTFKTIGDRLPRFCFISPLKHFFRETN